MKEMNVKVLPPCDICIGALMGFRNLNADEKISGIRYDSPTSFGPWGMLCPRHYRTCGMNSPLATRLILDTKPEPEPEPEPTKPPRPRPRGFIANTAAMEALKFCRKHYPWRVRGYNVKRSR
jgi:hypothetical protein